MRTAIAGSPLSAPPPLQPNRSLAEACAYTHENKPEPPAHQRDARIRYATVVFQGENAAIPRSAMQQYATRIGVA
jgi:hypothetical protein